MSTKLLATVGGVGIAAAAVAGGLYAGAAQVEEEPICHSLSEDSNYMNDGKTEVNTPYKDKYGHKYGLFLAGVTTKDATKADSTNEKWWTWIHKHRYQKNATGGFASTEITNATKLKEACTAVYGADKTVDNNGELTVSGKKYKEADVWKFCSSFGEKIKTLKDIGEGEKYTTASSYGSIENNKDDLVATTASTNKANKHFWSVKTEELKNSKTGLNESSEFKKLHKKLNGEANPENAKGTLRETCADAYGKTSSTGSNYPATEIAKFCSLTGTTPSAA